MWIFNSIVEGVFWVCDGLRDDNFVHWCVSISNWSSMISWQWSVYGASGHRCDEKSGNNEALRIKNKTIIHLHSLRVSQR
jgi:hypothetical protein